MQRGTGSVEGGPGCLVSCRGYVRAVGPVAVPRYDVPGRDEVGILDNRGSMLHWCRTGPDG